jgi:long-chain fatty acid transport protein
MADRDGTWHRPGAAAGPCARPDPKGADNRARADACRKSMRQKKQTRKIMKGEIMRYLATGSLVLLALATDLHAGGFERTEQSITTLFESGRHLGFGFSAGFPNVSGTASARTPTPGQESGNIGENFGNLSFAYKDDINDRLSYAILYGEPYGADIAYPISRYFASGSNAELRTRALTGILQYHLSEPGAAFGGQFSVYGGAIAQYIKASADVPFLRGYQVTSESQIGYGFLVGAAWERPELGQRISLTYSSEIQNDLPTQESFAGRPAVSTETEIDTPESINLEFQTGLNPKTLLFGSIRWVPWGDFEVSPPLYYSVTGTPLAFFPDDTYTYRLGLGRKINDNWQVFGSLGYEGSSGEPTTNLTPVDGFTSYSAGATYRQDKTRITVAARYVALGDANTILAGRSPAGQFTDNSLWGVGVQIAFDLN